ncbi:MAG: hypothetical protein OXU50_02325, partial [Gammaproteobacteria bacterium]|nr:hypothetical protein [Gammaproteobacteria bacterium]
DIVSPPGLDAAATTGVLTVPLGRTGLIHLHITDDTAPEDDETLRVVVGEPRTAGDAFASPNSATVIIGAGDQPAPAPALAIAADDFSGLFELDGSLRRTHPLTAAITRAAADTPPSLLTWQWRQVASTAADAAAVPATDLTVYLGAITSATGRFSSTGNVAASAAIRPLVYATGDYHFRLTVTATRADHLPTVVSDVVSVRFRDSDAPTTPEVSATGADAAATDGNGHLVLSVREGDRVVITTTATDLNPRGELFVLAEDRYYEWRTDNTADFFSAAFEPDVTPGRVTGFTVPTHPETGGATTYRHRVTAVDDGGERSAPRRVTIVHRDNAVPVADAGPDRQAGIDSRVMLDGRASLNARGVRDTGQLQYQWLQVNTDNAGAGVVTDGVVLRSSNTAVASFDAPSQMETLYFRLTVTDTNTLRSSFDTVAITVLPQQTLGIRSASPAVTEGGVIRFTVAIGEGQPASDGGVSADWSIGPGAAGNPAEPGDFDADGVDGPDTVFPSGTAVIAAGQVFTIVTVQTPDDLSLEGTETWRLALGNPRGNPGIFAELGAAEQSGEIYDNDLGNYSVSVHPAGVAEGGSVTFTLELAQALPVSLPVPFEVGGAGIEAGDFSVEQAPGVSAGVMGGTVTIPAAATRAQVVLAIADDDINEAAETLRMSFGEAGSGLGGDVVISGNDTIEVHIIGDEDAFFSGQYTGGLNRALDVVRNFPPFCSLGEFDLSGFSPGYELVEGTTATFKAVLGNFQGLHPGTYNGTFRSFPSAGDITVRWGVEIFIDDRRLSTAENPDFDFTAGTPGNERLSRGTSILEGRVTIPAGSTQAEIRFLVRDDGLNERGVRAGELGRIFLRPEGLSQIRGPGAGVVQYADGSNSCAASIHVTARQLTVAGPARIDETDSNISRDYLITMIGSPFTRDTNVTWQLTTGGPADRADDADFVLRTGSVRFGPGDPNGATRSFTVTVVGDNLNEATERSTVRVSVPDPNTDGGTRLFDPRVGDPQIGRPQNGGVDDPRNIGPHFGSMSLVIPDDDPITATVTGGGHLDEGATATVTVALDGGDLSRPAEVIYTLGADDRGATVDAVLGDDYTDPAGGRITIPVTGDRATIHIPSTDDGLNEASEVFLATVGFRSAGASTTVNPVRRFTIRDNDDITVSFADAALSIDEGRSARLAVGLSHPSAARLRVPYTVTAGGDNPPPFTDATGSPLVFEAGSTGGEIVLTSINTTDIDTGTGTLTLAFDGGGIDIGAAGGAVGVSGAAVVTVAFREFDREFSIAAAGAAANEGDTVAFTVALDGMAPNEPATVDWAIGGDVDARDYTAPASASGQLSFNATGSRVINVLIAADGLNETTETLTLTLSGARGGGGQNSGIITATAMVVIAASDPATATIAADRATVAEGATATFMVALAGGVPTTGVAVPFTVTGDAADYDIVLPGGLDAQATTGTLIIAAGSTGGRIGLAITDDDATEDAETLTVIIGAPRAAADIRLGAVNSATAAIAASDQPLPPPAVMTAADDFADDNLQGAAYILTGTAVRGAGDTAPPSTLTWQWLQVASTAAGAAAVASTDTAVWLGALSGATGTVSTDGIASAVITPDVYATGDYHFRLTVAAAKPGYKPSTASDVISVRFRDTDAPLQPAMAVTGDVTQIVCGDGGGACTLDVRQDEEVIVTVLSADRDEGELLEDRFFEWSTSGDSVSFFSAALEPDITPGRVTTFTVPAHPVRGGATTYRHRVVAVDSGGERGPPREVVIVHRDTAAPAAMAVADMPRATSGATVVLDGLGSRNAGGGVGGMTFRWRQVVSTSDDAEVIIAGDPGAVELINAGAATATFTAPLATPMLYFRLTVTDDMTLRSDSAAVAVEVRLPPRVLSVAPPHPAVAVEATTPAIVRLRLSGGVPHTAPVSVAWAVTGSAVTGDDDVEAADFCLADTRTALGALPRGTIEWMPGDNEAEIALTFCFDNLAEPQEFYDVVFSMLADGAGGAGTTEFSGGAGSATVSGRVDASGSAPVVSLSGPDAVGVEGTSQTWRVRLDRAHTQAVEVLYRISSVTSLVVVAGEFLTLRRVVDGASADDFAQVQGASVAALPLTGSVVIGAGGTQASIVLLYRNDDESGGADEEEEHFQISLTGFDGDPGALFAATLDTDGPVVSRGSIAGAVRAVAEVASRRVSAVEGMNAVFTITLDEAQAEATTVHWTLVGTAVRGVDYGGAGIAAGQLPAMTYQTAIEAGSTRADVTLDVADDGFNEATETIVIRVVRGGDVRPGAVSFATHRIEDNDPMAVRLSGGGEVAEGGAAAFTITLGSSPTTTVEVPWSVDAVGGSVSADDFSDYSGLPFAGTAIFTAGGTTAATVSVAIAADRMVEPQAQPFAFSVAASAVTGAYGETTVSGSPVGASIAADGAPPVVVSALQTPLAEEGDTSPTFVITLRDNAGPLLSGREIQMTWALTGTADSGADYGGGETGTATIAAGGSETRVVLSLVDDDDNESTETIVLTLSNPVPSGAVSPPLPAPVTLEILDNDVITATVAGPSSPVFEGATTTFTVLLSGGQVGAGETVTIPWRIAATAAADDDDAEASDFADAQGVPLAGFPTGAVSFGAGETERVISSIRIVNDGVRETTETFSLALGAAQNAAGVVVSQGMSSTATIAASVESRFVFSVEPESGAVEEPGGGVAALNFIVSATATGAAHESTLSVSYRLGGTAAPGSDYRRADGVDATTGTLMFGAGVTTRTVALSVVPDTYAETTETVVVSLGAPDVGANPGNAGLSLPLSSSVALIAPRDDQRLAIGLSWASGSVAESGGGAVFEITQTSPSTAVFEATATVTYTLSGTADAGADYDLPSGYRNSSGTVVLRAGWPGGASARTTVSLNDDALNEDDETIIARISGVLVAGGHWTANQNQQTLDLEDDDAITYSVSGPGAISEDAGQAVFTAALSGAASGSVALITVPFTIDTGAADASDVGALPSSPVQFAAGATSMEIAIPITEDTVNEATETLTLTLGTPATVGAGGGSVTRAADAADYTAMASIEDNDALTISLTPASQTVSEGSSAGFVLTVGGGEPGGVVTLTYTITGDSANANAADISLASLSGETTIGAGETSGAFGFGVLFDNSAEDEETLSVVLDEVAQAGHGAIAVAGTAQVVVPANDATARTLTVTGPASVTEADAAVTGDYRIDLSGRRFS